MILRRVIEHTRKQEWTAIFIDLVIVVVGVFIGIQVSNWNIERETNRRAAVFTERLKADLRVEAWGYDYLIEYNKDILANTERVLAAMSGDAPMSDEQFVIAAYRASQYSSNDRRRATYDELISTGTIGLIADQKLRLTAVMVFESPLFEQIFNEESRRSTARSSARRARQAFNERCSIAVVTGWYRRSTMRVSSSHSTIRARSSCRKRSYGRPRRHCAHRRGWFLRCNFDSPTLKPRFLTCRSTTRSSCRTCAR